VFEHVNSLKLYSANAFYFSHVDASSDFKLNLCLFDAVCIHFSVRLPFDQVSQSLATSLERYRGLKFLFIQDEYDFALRTRYWILRLGFHLIFTTVPSESVEKIYPSSTFKDTRFVQVLTGYVPAQASLFSELPPPSRRPILVGYRGRPLPLRYGQLGFDKVRIGELVKNYCDRHQLESDIAWSEEARIYGSAWYDFLGRCRAMLGSESGSNVFDWNGDLSEVILQYKRTHPNLGHRQVYDAVIRGIEVDGLMNQVSPKIFEAIAFRTALVLFEGAYSGVVRPWDHYIMLKKDGSNLDEVFRLLRDDVYVDAMVQRAWFDVIDSGRFSYGAFVRLVDKEVARSLLDLRLPKGVGTEDQVRALSSVTLSPVRSAPPKPSTDTVVNTVVGSASGRELVWRLAIFFWLKVPESVRSVLKPRLKQLLRKV
jgi:hypothetical protein